MLVCVFSTHFAHETAGAARIRHSLLPLPSRDDDTQTSGASRREMPTCICCLKFESEIGVTAVIARLDRRPSIPEAFEIIREAAAYWIARSSPAMTVEVAPQCLPAPI